MNRYSFSLIAAMAVLAPAAHAQATTHTDATAGHAQAGAQAGGEHEMMAKLNLSATQKAQIKAIRDKYAAQMKSMPGMNNMSGTGNMKGMAMPGMDKMRAQEMAEIRATLTPAQQTQFDAMMAEHQKGHDKNHAGKAHADSAH